MRVGQPVHQRGEGGGGFGGELPAVQGRVAAAGRGEPAQGLVALDGGGTQEAGGGGEEAAGRGQEEERGGGKEAVGRIREDGRGGQGAAHVAQTRRHAAPVGHGPTRSETTDAGAEGGTVQVDPVQLPAPRLAAGHDQEPQVRPGQGLHRGGTHRATGQLRKGREEGTEHQFPAESLLQHLEPGTKSSQSGRQLAWGAFPECFGLESEGTSEY